VQPNKQPKRNPADVPTPMSRPDQLRLQLEAFALALHSLANQTEFADDLDPAAHNWNDRVLYAQVRGMAGVFTLAHEHLARGGYGKDSHRRHPTDGQALRAAAELIDRVEDSMDLWAEKEQWGPDMNRRRLYPHLRTAAGPATCPLCGRDRDRLDAENVDGSRSAGWTCGHCLNTVSRAEKILLDPDAPTPMTRAEKRLAERNAKQATPRAVAGATTATVASVRSPTHFDTFLGLPFGGVLDCRTKAEREADEAAGRTFEQVAAGVVAEKEASGELVPVPPAKRRKGKPAAKAKKAAKGNGVFVPEPIAERMAGGRT
jgi:hypothetical protein